MPSLDNQFLIDCELITCPSGDLGAMGNQSQDCNNVNQSEVDSLIFWHPTKGTKIQNWGPSLQASDFIIDNTDASDVNQKQIFVKGGKPEPEDIEVKVNNFQTVVISRTHSLNIMLFDFDSVTYDYLRKLQCGKVKPVFAFTTVAQQIYGKDGGIVPTKFSVKHVLEEGEESVEHFKIDITWKSLTAADRFVNPLP